MRQSSSGWSQSPRRPLQAADGYRPALGPVSKISEFFVVAPNGNLLALSASTKQGTVQTLALSGFALAPGSSATFTYNGGVTIGALALLQGHTPTHGIVAGQKSIVTVLGSGEHAQMAVTASGYCDHNFQFDYCARNIY